MHPSLIPESIINDQSERADTPLGAINLAAELKTLRLYLRIDNSVSYNIKLRYRRELPMFDIPLNPVPAKTVSKSPFVLFHFFRVIFYRFVMNKS
jgi:hypothetical protein